MDRRFDASIYSSTSISSPLFLTSTKLGVVVATSDKRLKELAVMRGARNRVVRLAIDGQSGEALYAFANQVQTHLVDRFRVVWAGAHSGSRMAYSYRLTHVSGVGSSSVEVQGPAPHGAGGGDLAATSPSTPWSSNPSTHVPSKLSNPPAKGSFGRSKKTCR